MLFSRFIVLRISRRHRLDGRTEGLDVAFADAERSSHFSHINLNRLCGRVRPTKDAPHTVS